MGSGGVHKSLGRFESMILIRRKTGNVRADRVKKRRAFALALPAFLAWLRPTRTFGAAAVSRISLLFAVIAMGLFVPMERADAASENRFAGAAVSDRIAPTAVIAWTNLGNIVSDNDLDANSDMAPGGFDSNEVHDHLRSRSYGFTIPAGATIDGIEVQVEIFDANAPPQQNYRRGSATRQSGRDGRYRRVNGRNMDIYSDCADLRLAH